jgi:hypothetical protein
MADLLWVKAEFTTKKEEALTRADKTATPSSYSAKSNVVNGFYVGYAH